MSPLLLLLNAALVLGFAFFVLALLKLPGRPAYLLALYILACADIVAVLQIAGLLGSVNRPVVAILQIAFTAVALVLWLRAGRPSLLGPFARFTLRIPRRNWRFALKLVSLILVAGSVGYVYALSAKFILATFPNNYDSLTYHLSRVGYWLQYGSFYPWPTPNLRQTTFPMNAELGVLWTVLWLGIDRLSGFVQWITVPVSVLGIYGLTRLLGYPRWQSAVAGLLWATLTQVLFQSTTTQNDLVTASFWVACTYLLFAGLRARRPALLYLSALSLGLAVGAKSTSLVMLPGLALALLAVLVVERRKRELWPSLVRWGAACLLGLALFGSYAYVQNIVAFGNPLGASTPRTGPRVLQPPGGKKIYLFRLRDNLGRYTYQMVDFSPLPGSLPQEINPAKASLFGDLFQALGISVTNPVTMNNRGNFSLAYINPLNEDASWFGPLAIVLIISLFAQAYRGVRERDALRLSLVIIAITFLVLHSAAQNWTPWKGRYYMLPVTVSFPLIAALLQTRSYWRSALASLVILLGLAVMFNVARLSGLHSIGWRSLLAGERRDPSWEIEFNYRLLAESVPANASIGLVSEIDFRDYPFFGEQFTRRVTLAVPEDARILPRTDIGRYESDFQNSDYLFLTEGGTASARTLASQKFSLLSDDGTNSLWIRNELRSPRECDTARWPFSELFRSSSEAVCPRFPIYPGLAEGGNTRIIIAPATNGQLQFDLLVKKSSEVTFAVQIAPRHMGIPQVLQLSLSGAGSPPQEFSETFSRKRTLKFPATLGPGTYSLTLSLAPGSTEARVIRIDAIVR